MEINTGKIQVMSNVKCTSRLVFFNNSEEIKEVNTFKYLGFIIDDKGSKKGIISRIEQTTSVLKKLSAIWNDRIIILKSKI